MAICQSFYPQRIEQLEENFIFQFQQRENSQIKKQNLKILPLSTNAVSTQKQPHSNTTSAY